MQYSAMLLSLLTSTILISSTSSALADTKDDRIQRLEQQMIAIMQELQDLKAMRNLEQQEQEILQKQVQAIEENATSNIAQISPAAGEISKNIGNTTVKDDVKITMSPSPKITKSDFSWQPFGRLHLDAAHFFDDKTDHPSGAEFRRARLGMKGKVSKDFGYKIQLDFANEGVAFKDVYLNYTGIDGLEIRAGNHKPAFGMENMTSANDITFIERSAVSSAFETSQIIGLGGFAGGDNWSFGAGIYNDDAGTQSTSDEARSTSARLTFAPVADENNTLHFGLAGSYREPDQANDTFDFDARAENALQSTDSVSAVLTTSESAALYGVELAGVLGPFSAQGEYFHAKIDNNAGRNPRFNGGYVQASWILTGERRPYIGKAGKFGRIVPKNPLDPSKGHWGAWELAARYSTIDLTDASVSGGEMDNYTAGLNWYINKNIRLMGNYIAVDTDSTAPSADDDPQILLFRTQIDF